jgi:3-oxoacyl-[acyl-carrier-protein] synthase-3
MNISTIKGVRIEAIAACVPSQKIDNAAFAQAHLANDCSATINAIGTIERHVVAQPHTGSLDLAVEAAKMVLAGVDKEEIGAVVMVTTTPDFILPNNATQAQHLLGLPNSIVTFDINHTCPGYVYGLWNAALICQNLQKKILLLTGDVNSKTCSPWDYDTALLYGDAGTATILTPDTQATDWNFTFYADGSGKDSLYIPFGFKHPVTAQDLDYQTLPNGGKRRNVDMIMDAQATIDFELMTTLEVIQAFMDELETEADEYDQLILNQSNFFVMRKIAKALGFNWKEKLPKTIDRYGNTTSSSVPLTITSELKDQDTDKVLMVAQGAGLAAGIADVSLDGATLYGVKEIDA